MIKQNIELKSFSTFRIGGVARYFCTVRSVKELKKAVEFAHQQSLYFKVVGKGSNILFEDRGFDGLIICNQMRFCSINGQDVYASSGYPISQLAKETSNRSLLGLQFAYLLPATVGGALYMNASAYNQKISTYFKEALYMLPDGSEQIVTKEQLQFSYRYSSFQEMGGVIIGAKFSLPFSQEASFLLQSFAQKRKESQPLEAKSCGCVFKNPVQGSAALLIDRCNLKGKSIGGAQVSEKHANFIINTGNASAENVEELIAYVQHYVYQQTGVFLETEMIKLPYSNKEKR